VFERRHVKQTISFKDRVASFAQEMREKASLLPPGTEKEHLLRKASRADITFHLDDWANSPGLQPPK
jgi:hypothetical protein